MSSITLVKLVSISFATLPLSIGGVIPEKRQNGLTVYTLDGWQSLGCWSDSQASRTLSLMAHSGQHCSDDNCQYQCTQLGYNYAGTEYSGQCYCDNYVNSAATQKADSDCNMACTGNPNQPCGGPDRINLFWNGKTATPKPATVTNPGVDGWVSEGCYTDSVGSRTLANRVNTNGGGSAMSVQLCVDACKSGGYSLAGAEYGGECYCDNTIENGGSASDQTTCSMTCNGNSTEYCGGPGRLNLYSYGGATPVASTPQPTTPVTKENPTLPSNFANLGCYTDTNGQRTLSHGFNAPSGGMTVEKCINLCSTNGYTIAGVEYGSECYCDNVIQNNHGLAPDGNAGCNMPCSGDAGETCGGPNRLNAYAAGPGWVQLGCFTDQQYSRTLAINGGYSGDLTVEKCLAVCQALGYAYSGVEYGKECHCGNSFDNGGGPAPDGAAGCSFQCAGDSSEICGGNGRLSMYEYINSDGTVKSSAPTSGNTTENTGGNTAPAPKTSNLPAGWAYDGCYVDGAQGRILQNQQPDSNSLTIESCISTCTANGYSVAGLEYSKQCFCGNKVINGGVQASASQASSNCHMPCSGSATESCGGPGLMELYSQGTLSTQAAATVQTSGLPDSWAYQGCISDQPGARTFAVENDFPSTNSATTCLNYCNSQGYTAAGMEYAGQCFCGNPSDVSSSGATTSTNCNMACSGDSDYICGGPGALNWYSLQNVL